jgi:hypothetical protein
LQRNTVTFDAVQPWQQCHGVAADGQAQQVVVAVHLLQLKPRRGSAFADAQRQGLIDRCWPMAGRSRLLQSGRQRQLLLILTLGRHQSLLRRLPEQTERRDTQDKHTSPQAAAALEWTDAPSVVTSLL